MGSLWPPEVEFGEETANALAVDCKQDEGKRPPRQIASLAHLSNVTTSWALCSLLGTETNQKTQNLSLGELIA